ncbi:MAG: DNA-3-methyladenine glycosylase [Pyrinomonadaceae bacterium]
MKLKRNFYSRDDTIGIARDLLGKLLVVPDDKGRRISGMIVETEAYLGLGDRAAHSFGGRRTPRNEVMYGPAGRIYVFFVYGMYYQFNVVCGPVDHPHAILIRGVEPVEGIEKMRERRGFLSEPGASGAPAGASPRGVLVATGSKRDKNLTSGPGKLCIAMNINRDLNGEDLLGHRVWLEEHRSFADDEIAVGKRIGIDYAGEDAEKPWRFWVKGNEFVSQKT